jgi:hypothetical protein
MVCRSVGTDSEAGLTNIKKMVRYFINMKDKNYKPITLEDLGLTDQEMEDMAKFARIMYPELAKEAEKDAELFSGGDLDKP